ncbi:MAG: LamB/YcsF family protein [Clostridiaceae bacterium]|nr:LamB/YcsF family protein [Clostridiaceae bacterium]
MGESFGRYKLGMDEDVIPYITSANVACGFHAGDPHVMNKTVMLAKKYGVSVGAHPGYPDLLGFGRRKMDVSPEEIKDYIVYQVGALKAFCEVHGVKLQHIKPHGALYNAAGKDPVLARAIAEAVYEVDKELIFLVLAGSEMEKAGKEVGLKTAREVFGDRNYREDGSLVPRSHPKAVLKDDDEVARRVVRMVTEGKVLTIEGKDIDVEVDSICVHGDTLGAINFIKRIRKDLQEKGVEIASLDKIFGKHA